MKDGLQVYKGIFQEGTRFITGKDRGNDHATFPAKKNDHATLIIGERRHDDKSNKAKKNINKL
jgi:hypothetical protein